MGNIKLQSTNGSVTLTPEDGAGNIDLTVPRAGFGKVLQVVSSTVSTIYSVASPSFVNSGAELDITLKNQNSKVKVTFVFSCGYSADNYAGFAIYRNGIELTSRTEYPSNAAITSSLSTVVLETEDTPNSISPITYSIYAKHINATVYIGTNGSNNQFGDTSITLTEIGN